MFFLFSLGAEMIGAGSLLSHAREKRDKPQTAQGQRGDTWVLNPSVGQDLGALQEGGKQAATWQALPQSSWSLLEPPPRPGHSVGLDGNLQPREHHDPELQEISKGAEVSVPKLIQLLNLMIDKVFLAPLIQTLHPGSTSSDQPPK